MCYLFDCREIEMDDVIHNIAKTVEKQLDNEIEK